MWYIIAGSVSAATLTAIYFLLLPKSAYHYSRASHTGRGVGRVQKQDRDKFGWDRIDPRNNVGRVSGDWIVDGSQLIRIMRLPV